MNRILDKTAIQQKIGFGGPGILRINKLLALSPLRRRAHATSHRRRPRPMRGRRRQYSAAIQVYRRSRHLHPDTLTLPCWSSEENRTPKEGEGETLVSTGPQATTISSKSRNACKPANKVALQNAPWRARHHGAPSPPGDGDTTGGGGGGSISMQLHRGAA